jgi:hypothetical protein
VVVSVRKVRSAGGEAKAHDVAGARRGVQL